MSKGWQNGTHVIGWLCGQVSKAFIVQNSIYETTKDENWGYPELLSPDLAFESF